ncbi:MAG: hypothetical protein KF718_22990 [Polyangiaceae bacterium]|nr:hypothetical protein [Polyangiaceae bacterium]
MRRSIMLGLGLALLGCGGDDSAAAAPATKDSGAGGAGAGGQAGGGAGGAVGGSGGQPSGGGGGQSTGGGAGTAGAGGGVAVNCPAPKPPGTSTFNVTSSGTGRSARLVIPASYDATKTVPLVLVLHGYTETAQQIETISKMTPVAEQYGFVVAYPSGISNAWNAGKCCGSASLLNRPDVKFLSDLIDALGQELCIDPKRIYAAGFSNGAMLSNRLGCELSGRFAAIAPVAGPIAIDGCSPTRAMPIIQFHGTSDGVVPYNGGGLGGAISLPANTDFWRNNNGCTDAAPTQVFQNGDSTCVEYQSCTGGAAVRTCTVDGGGHQWPGGTSAGAGGKLTQDIKASEEMAKFFLAHSLP